MTYIASGTRTDGALTEHDDLAFHEDVDGHCERERVKTRATRRRGGERGGGTRRRRRRRCYKRTVVG